MYDDDLGSKMKAQANAANRVQCPAEPHPVDQCTANQAVGSGPNPYYRSPSPLEEMEKQLAHHDESFSRIAKGATFLREHPEFNEFIQLIRTGSISI